MPSQPTQPMRPARWPAIAALLVLTLALVLPAAADTPGRAYGTVTVAGKTIRLTHAYVQEPWLAPEPRNHAPYVAGKFVVTLSDAPILDDFPRRFGLPFSGYPSAIGIHGVTFMFDRASGQATECILFDSPDPDWNAFTSPATESGYSSCKTGDDAMTTTVYALRGNLLTAAVHSGVAGASSRSEKILRSGIAFNLAFTAPIDWAPRLLATLTGDEANSSAPARMYREWLAALGRYDPKIHREAVRAEMDSGRILKLRLRPAFHWPNDPIMTIVIMKGLHTIYIYEDRVVLVFADDTPTYLEPYRHPQVVPMILQDGQWKLGE